MSWGDGVGGGGGGGKAEDELKGRKKRVTLH